MNTIEFNNSMQVHSMGKKKACPPTVVYGVSIVVFRIIISLNWLGVALLLQGIGQLLLLQILLRVIP